MADATLRKNRWPALAAEIWCSCLGPSPSAAPPLRGIAMAVKRDVSSEASAALPVTKDGLQSKYPTRGEPTQCLNVSIGRWRAQRHVAPRLSCASRTRSARSSCDRLPASSPEGLLSIRRPGIDLQAQAGVDVEFKDHRLTRRTLRRATEPTTVSTLVSCLQ